MRTVELFDLAEGWSIKADSLQWMLCRKGTPVSYIGSYKRHLKRVIREKGITPTPEGQEALDSLPKHFRLWLSDNRGLLAQKKDAQRAV